MSDNVRVYEIAEEAGASSNEVIAKAKDLVIELKSPQTAVSFVSCLFSLLSFPPKISLSDFITFLG